MINVKANHSHVSWYKKLKFLKKKSFIKILDETKCQRNIYIAKKNWLKTKIFLMNLLFTWFFLFITSKMSLQVFPLLLSLILHPLPITSFVKSADIKKKFSTPSLSFVFSFCHFACIDTKKWEKYLRIAHKTPKSYEISKMRSILWNKTNTQNELRWGRQFLSEKKNQICVGSFKNSSECFTQISPNKGKASDGSQFIQFFDFIAISLCVRK